MVVQNDGLQQFIGWKYCFNCTQRVTKIWKSFYKPYKWPLFLFDLALKSRILKNEKRKCSNQNITYSNISIITYFAPELTNKRTIIVTPMRTIDETCITDIKPATILPPYRQLDSFLQSEVPHLLQYFVMCTSRYYPKVPVPVVSIIAYLSRIRFS